MKILLSPAKKLNYDIENYLLNPTEIRFSKESQQLVNKLKKLKPSEISKLMKLSQNLADLNFERYQEWDFPFEQHKAKPAAFAFDGEAYTGLDIRSFNKNELEQAQEKLYILSGLYGILRPLDLIMPYRLEMGTSFSYTHDVKNLYQYWSSVLTNKLLDNLTEQEIVVNLASKEYSKAIDFGKVKNTVITPVFKENKAGNYKVVMVYAKKARGLMTSYLIKQNIETIDGIKAFDIEGYSFKQELSSDTEFVFTR